MRHVLALLLTFPSFAAATSPSAMISRELKSTLGFDNAGHAMDPDLREALGDRLKDLIAAAKTRPRDVGLRGRVPLFGGDRAEILSRARGLADQFAARYHVALGRNENSSTAVDEALDILIGAYAEAAGARGDLSLRFALGYALGFTGFAVDFTAGYLLYVGSHVFDIEQLHEVGLIVGGSMMTTSSIFGFVVATSPAFKISRKFVREIGLISPERRRLANEVLDTFWSRAARAIEPDVDSREQRFGAEEWRWPNRITAALLSTAGGPATACANWLQPAAAKLP